MSAYDSTVAVPLSVQTSWPLTSLQAGVACAAPQSAGEHTYWHQNTLLSRHGEPVWHGGPDRAPTSPTCQQNVRSNISNTHNVHPQKDFDNDPD